MIRTSSLIVSAIIAAAAVVSPTSAQAQEAPTQYQQAISANPFGLLLEFFNAEYERVVGESSTVGIGGSYLSDDADGDEFAAPSDDKYVNADVFYRFYPSGRPLEGWAFGAKVGLTSVSDYGTYFGYGFDLNRSWLLGKKNNFYVGAGFGLKRLVGTPDDEVGFDLQYIPTIRLINVGWAF